jgi:hypothetical protein
MNGPMNVKKDVTFVAFTRTYVYLVLSTRSSWQELGEDNWAQGVPEMYIENMIGKYIDKTQSDRYKSITYVRILN